MTLLADALHAGGGLDLWRQMRRFTVHISIGGALCARKCRTAQLKDLVAEGGTQQQALEITGFTANDRRALYRPHWVALEGLEGQRLQERDYPAIDDQTQTAQVFWEHQRRYEFVTCFCIRLKRVGRICSLQRYHSRR